MSNEIKNIVITTMLSTKTGVYQSSSKGISKTTQSSKTMR